MGRAAAGSRAVLERLAAAGLELHLQVVLCPGWNDGDVLAETVRRTGALEAVADLGVVPVSLAAEGDLRRVTPDEARSVIAAVEDVAAGVPAGGAARPSCTPPTSSTCSPARIRRRATRPSSTRTAWASPPRCSPTRRRWRRRGAESPAGRATCRQRRRTASPGSACSAARSPLRCSHGPPRCSRRRPASPCGPSASANALFGPHVTVTGLLGGAEVLQALRRDPLADGEWLVAPRVWLPGGARPHAGRRRRGRPGGRLRRPPGRRRNPRRRVC